ncbi:hypothetical protein Vretifemale_8520 [Volvox reticuliferus]|uniref:Uncharacterized protein n=1 Tax=Volvox reticuliferus TaxID=1737510 RepID=A0A8J4FKQ9_9CHLO|nr:hypothetical protein Vretifemale_8520 [Volvox reticuliferus]
MEPVPEAGPHHHHQQHPPLSRPRVTLLGMPYSAFSGFSSTLSDPLSSIVLSTASLGPGCPGAFVPFPRRRRLFLVAVGFGAGETTATTLPPPPPLLPLPPSSSPPTLTRGMTGCAIGNPVPSRGRDVHPSVRPSIRPSIRPSVRPSVHPSVRPSVRPSIRPSVRPSAIK